MQIGHYISMMHKSSLDIARAFRTVAKEHGDEPDIKETCGLLAAWADEQAGKIRPFTEKYSPEESKAPDRLMNTLFNEPRKGSLGLLRDLQDLWLMTSEGEICCIVLRQAASGLRDKDLIEVCDAIEKKRKRQSSWLLTRIKSSATQTLIVAL